MLPREDEVRDQISLPHRSFLKSIFLFRKAILSSHSQKNFKILYVITTGQSGASLKIAA